MADDPSGINVKEMIGKPQCIAQYRCEQKVNKKNEPVSAYQFTRIGKPYRHLTAKKKSDKYAGSSQQEYGCIDNMYSCFIGKGLPSTDKKINIDQNEKKKDRYNANDIHTTRLI
jgi:hypothetical protein